MFGARVPTIVLGLSVSIGVHAGLLAALSLVPSGRGPGAVRTPTVAYALGRPVPVRIGSQIGGADGPVPRAETVPPTPMGPAAALPGTKLAEAFMPSVSAALLPRDGRSSLAPRGAQRGVIGPADGERPRSARATQGRPSGPPAEDGDVGLPPAAVVAPAMADSAAATTAQAEADVDERRPAASPAASEPQEAASERAAGSEPVSAPEPAPASAPAPAPASVGTPSPPGLERGVDVVSVPSPVYPRRSIRLGHEGTVVVEVVVGVDGTVESARLRATSGHRRLDDAALAAARAGMFRPALVDGQPVASVVLVPFEFRLSR